MDLGAMNSKLYISGCRCSDNDIMFKLSGQVTVQKNWTLHEVGGFIDVARAGDGGCSLVPRRMARTTCTSMIPLCSLFGATKTFGHSTGSLTED